MNTTTPRKLIVTKGLKRKWLGLATARYVANRRKDPSKSLTHCRDVYWKKYPHFYRRLGRMIYRLRLSPSLNRPRKYDEFAEYMDRLSEQDLLNAVDELNKQLNPVVVTPPPDPEVKVQNTNIELDPCPDGFTDIERWRLNPIHKVDTDQQHQLQSRLRQALMSVSQCRVVRGLNDGDLDMDRLTDIGAGINMSGLFRRTVPAKRLSVAVQIYADISYSMNEDDGLALRRADLQLRLCITLAQVLERLRIPTQIIAYDDKHYLVKDWNRSLANAMVWTMPIANGDTDLPEAVTHGFRLFAPRHEDRHVAVIISDGDIGADTSLAQVDMHDSENGQTWHGYPPTILPLRKVFPKVETCFFGIGQMQIPDGTFNFRRTGLGANIVEQVSNDVVNVIVKR